VGSIADHNVFQLQIILDVAGLMDLFVLLEQLHAYLHHRFEREGLIKIIQVMLQGVSKLLLDEIGPVVLLVEVLFRRYFYCRVNKFLV
jgi:hypothetical protein